MAEGKLKIGDFKGIDQSVNEMSIPDGASPDAQNVRCEGGLLARTKGCVKYADQPVPGGVISMAAFYSRKQPKLLAVAPGGIYSFDKETGWTLELAQEGMGQANFLNYAKDGKDCVVIANRQGIWWWDGVEKMECLPGAPEGLLHLTLHYERVWGAGRELTPDTVYWSRPYDPTDWSPHSELPEAGGGFVMVPTWNGGRVKGLKNLFNDVVVFKDQDILRIYGTYPGNYEVVQVHGIVGPIAERTIVAWGDRVFFLSREGLCAYNGVSAQPIDKGRARRFFDGIDMVVAQSTACAAVYKDILYIALPEMGHIANNAILTIDLRRDVWMIRRGLRVDDFLLWENQLLVCNDTGYVYAFDQGEDYDGQPIQSYWTSKLMDCGAKRAKKRAGELCALGTGELVLVQETEHGKRSRTMYFGSKMRLRVTRLRGIGRRMRLRLENRHGKDFCIEGGIEWQVEVEEE